MAAGQGCLRARLTFGQTAHSIILDRIGQGSSATFTTRLPADVPIAQANVCVFDSSGCVSNELPLEVRAVAQGPAFPTQPLQSQSAIPAPQPVRVQIQPAADTTPKSLAQRTRQQARTQRRSKPYAPRPPPRSAAPVVDIPQMPAQVPAHVAAPCAAPAAGALSRNCSWDAETWNLVHDGRDAMSPILNAGSLSRVSSMDLLGLWTMVSSNA